MIRTLDLGNQKIQYRLVYKNVVNINLRIRPDCTISVSANERVPVKEIDAFVASKADFIRRALEQYAGRAKVKRNPYFTEEALREEILRLCKAVYPYYEKIGVPYPTILFRRMVSRWGSCHSQRGILTFNSNLMYAPPECVRYVVLHEFTHFLHPDHSKGFYAALAVVCPDWQACRRKLKEIQIR